MLGLSHIQHPKCRTYGARPELAVYATQDFVLGWTEMSCKAELARKAKDRHARPFRGKTCV